MQRKIEFPTVIDLASHPVEIIITDDENIFGAEERLGKYSLDEMKIWIRGSMTLSLKWAVLFHEIWDLSLAYFNVSYSHDEFQRYSLLFFDILVRNKLDFGRMI